MLRIVFPAIAVALLGAGPSMAQDQSGQPSASGVNCDDPANRDNDECLLLPPPAEATNFVFAIAPLLAGGVALAAIAAAGAGGGTATTSTSP